MPDYSSVLSAPVTFAASGDNTLVAAVAGKVIKLVRIFVVAAAATNLTFKDGAVALSGALPMTANGSVTLDLSDSPWFSTSSVSNNLILNSSAAVQVSGTVYYILV